MTKPLTSLKTYPAQSKLKLFPYVLIRIGGDTFEHYAHFNFSQTIKYVNELNRLRSQLREEKITLCDQLFEYIQSREGEQENQNIVQNLRRDIFNERSLKSGKIKKARAVLPSNLQVALKEYLTLSEEIQLTEERGAVCYQTELIDGRRHLQRLADNENLRRGLILSSQTLLNRLGAFQERAPEKFRKKEIQIEHGLLQYLTRMCIKTSPFSTFTNLAITNIVHNPPRDTPIEMSDKESSVISHMRLNNYLFKYLTDLLKNYRPAYLNFQLRCNPTFQNKGDHFLYLTNNNNIESFQRIPFNPVVEHIATRVKNERNGLKFGQLIDLLTDDIEATKEDLENYVQQLVDYGLLEYHLGVSGIDPDWDLKLIHTLEPIAKIQVPHIGELVMVLRQVRNLGNEYADSDVNPRRRILQTAFDSVRNICMKIHEAAGLPADERKTEAERLDEWREQKKKEKSEQPAHDQKEKENSEEVFKHETSTMFSFRPEQIFYEDTTREVEASIDASNLSIVVDAMDELLNQMRLFQGNQDEKDKMLAYFLEKYGAEDPVDLLTFYEDYFRELKKPEKEREERLKEEARKKREGGNDPNGEPSEKAEDSFPNQFTEIEALKKRKADIEQWKEAFKGGISDRNAWNQHEIDFDLDVLKKANEAAEFYETQRQENSYGAFLQIFEEHGKLKAVVNSTFPGYGKMTSRFLHIFDPIVTQQTREWNLDQAEDKSIFIEDCDASYFNANLHPTLMPYEIWMPGGHNALPVDRQIPITDFEVVIDKDSESLILRQKSTGCRAFVFDLGFQGHQGRSQLFQLLEKFTKAEYLHAYPAVNALMEIAYPKKQSDEYEEIEKESSQAPQIKVYPRVTYRDTLILQRKTWYVPKSWLPQRLPEDNDWQYFQKVNKWREENDIPHEVFVFVNPNRWGMDNLDTEQLKKLTRDAYKPQYMDFANPLLVNLLGKLIDKVPLSMKIVEMMPSSEQMLRLNEKRYVTEFVVQWYNRNGNTDL